MPLAFEVGETGSRSLVGSADACPWNLGPAWSFSPIRSCSELLCPFHLIPVSTPLFLHLDVMREFSGVRPLLVLAVAAAGMLIAGCDSPPTACTEEFVAYSVQVLSPKGEPADSVAIGVRNADTETDYNVCADNLCRQDRENGHYIIFHDGLEVSPSGNHVVVTGQKDSLTFGANYIFRQGECHVRKESGPEQVTLSE